MSFYTDREGRVRPITMRIPTVYKEPTLQIYSQDPQYGKVLFEPFSSPIGVSVQFGKKALEDTEGAGLGPTESMLADLFGGRAMAQPYTPKGEIRNVARVWGGDSGDPFQFTFFEDDIGWHRLNTDLEGVGIVHFANRKQAVDAYKDAISRAVVSERKAHTKGDQDDD